jgi:hypothetical protein
MYVNANHIYYYYYRYSALGPVWAETRAQSGDWYDSGTLHPGQILRGSLPLLSPLTTLLIINIKCGVWRIDFKNDIIIKEYLCSAVIFFTGVTYLWLII